MSKHKNKFKMSNNSYFTNNEANNISANHSVSPDIDSVLLKVDEDTEELMTDISEGIIEKVEEPLSNIKDNTDLIMEKLQNFDGLNSSLEEIKQLAQGSKNLSDAIPPIQSRISVVEDNLNGIQSKVASKDDIVSALASQKSEIENIITEVGQKIDGIANTTNTEIEKLKQDISSAQETISEFKRETDDQISELRKSIEKVQATLDIVVNLTTPFWKKWWKK